MEPIPGADYRPLAVWRWLSWLRSLPPDSEKSEKSEQDYFELCFPSNLLPDIAAGMTAKGKVLGFGSGRSVLVGVAWRFLGYSLAILISHSGGPKEDCWLEAGREKYKNVFFLAPDLGRFGLTYSKYCKMMHAFTMPM
eukprot:jgi/Tetstr1/464730/TSEL_009477.t1